MDCKCSTWVHTAFHHIDSLFVHAEPSPTSLQTQRTQALVPGSGYRPPAKDTTGGWVNYDFYYYLRLVCGT